MNFSSFGTRASTPPPFFVSNVLDGWWDADDANTITHVSNAVTDWLDKSGQGRHASQSTSGNRPTTNTRTIGGRNAIDWNGTTNFMVLASSPNVASGQTAFFVFRNDTVTASRPLIGSNDTVATWQVRTSNAGLFGTVRTGVAVLLNGSPAISTATDYIGAANFSTSGNDVYINGTSYGSNATSTTFTNGQTWIGGAGAAGTTPFLFHDGLIGEILIYRGNLTNAQKNIVGNYLAAKWGLTWTGL